MVWQRHMWSARKGHTWWAQPGAASEGAAAAVDNVTSACTHQEGLHMVAQLGGPQGVSVHFCSRVFGFIKGKRTTCPQPPHTPPSEHKCCISDHMAFYKYIYRVIFYFHICVHICVYLYIHIPYICMIMPTACKEGLKDTQLFASLGKDMIFSTIPTYPLKQKLWKPFPQPPTCQPARPFVMSNC